MCRYYADIQHCGCIECDLLQLDCPGGCNHREWSRHDDGDGELFRDVWYERCLVGAIGELLWIEHEPDVDDLQDTGYAGND